MNPDHQPAKPRRRLFRGLVRTSVHDERDLLSYVVRITAACMLVALTGDAINQLTFFIDWTTTLRSWSITVSITLLLAGPISYAVGRAHLELYQAKQAVERLSRLDPMTGLGNRRSLIEMAEATSAETMVLVIFDIDRFKRINDLHGHLVGDQVILAVCNKMVGELAGLGHLCRLGGEEFALLGGTADTERVLDAVWSLRDHLSEQPLVIGDLSVSVTVSAGIAVGSAGGTFNQVYAEADRALYAAKAAGRNSVSYSNSLDANGEPDGEPAGADRRHWRSRSGEDASRPPQPDKRSVA